MKQQPVFFKTPSDWRSWLKKHHASESELWVGFYKKASGKESITWDQSVQEAICFGWIDGIRKSVDDQCYTIRFTPRKPGSNWSLKNLKTAEEMVRIGFMHSGGLKAFNERKEERSGIYSFEQEKIALSKTFELTFRKNEKAWEYFGSQPPYYRKIAMHWVMSAKREATRERRLETLIADSEAGIRIKQLRR